MVPTIRHAAAHALVLLLIGVGVVAAPSHAATDTGGAQAVRTVAQDGRGATFDVAPGAARLEPVRVGGVEYTRVALPGAVVLEAPGRPSLPTLSLHVAIPEGMSPRIRVAAEEWETSAGAPPLPVLHQRFVEDDPRKGPVSEYRTSPDAAVYRGATAYPAESAALGNGALVGEWWVAPIHIHPVRWDPRSGEYRVLRKMTVRVDFVPATDRELALRPATRPGAQARVWDRVQKGLVRNYEAARSFPARPQTGTRGALPSGSGVRSRLAVNPEWRLSIAERGWYSVSYATLAGGGFPSGIPIANVRIEERGYDDAADTATVTPIPVVARDNNGNTLFDAGDAVTFYARSLRDRYGTGHIELRYSDFNVYWLTWGDTPAPTPGTVSGNIAGTPTVPVSFRDVIRMEQDNAIMNAPNRFVTTPPEANENLFWTDGLDGDQFETAIPFIDPDTSEPFRIRSRYQGYRNQLHRVDIFFQGLNGVRDTLAYDQTFADQDVYLLDTGFTIPGEHIAPGVNLYQHTGLHRANISVPYTDPSYAPLDVIEVTYGRLYRARNNVLRFTSGNTLGLVELHVGGFTGAVAPAIEVYDITDPLSPLRVTDVPVVATGAGIYEIQFRTDASGGERRFFAMVPGMETVLAGGSVASDVPSNLRQPGAYGASSVARTILITPGPFQAEAARLADYRRSQGYVVELAEVQDVYDEFNGGIKSARALRRYIRHAYLAWTPRPTYVLLVGDASLDYRHHLPASSVDWIPSYIRFDTIPSGFGNELVTSDPYYALNLAQPEPGTFSVMPSVSLSRIPASSAGEVAAFVDKVIAYENFQPSDTWRGRQLLFSDDEFSTTISFAGAYCFQPPEFEFKVASQDMADITAQSPGGDGIDNILFDLKTYTDQVPAAGGCKNLFAVGNKLAEPGGGYDDLMDQIAIGGLIFNLQTHANRYLIAHEEVLTNGTTEWVFLGSPNTPDRVQNVNRPFYLMVWGCHTNQFADNGLFSRRAYGTIDSTDAIGEVWMALPNRGSIASLGSSAYEFLSTNHNYNIFTAQAFYETPPTPTPAPGEEPQARWILGEVMLQAQVRNALASGGGYSLQQEMNHTIHLFADPMLRMDALPPRVFEATVAGTPVLENAPLTVDSPTDSLPLIAQLRDEVGIDSVYLAELDLASGTITPLDTLSYSVAYTDSSRIATLTANVRPRVGNYDFQIRAVDVNGRLRVFALQVRTPIRYLANGTEIVNGVFVESGAVLRAEVTSPIPLTADSLQLLIDGIAVASTKTQLDTAGRQWALQAQAGNLITGSHTIQVAIGGRTAGLDQRTFQTTSEFTIRGVAVVDPRVKGAGCGGSVFQYELSAVARKVELVLFTVSGRRVQSITMPGQAGLNVACWDGRDSQAHDTAQGVYLYRIRATDANGKTVTRDGRLIRAR